MSDVAVVTAPGPARSAGPGATALLPMWPLGAMFGLMPLWWLLGVWYVIWPLFGLVLAALLVVRGGLRAPAGTRCWLVLLGIVAVSATRLGRVTGLLTFGLRFGHLLTAFLVGLYVYTVAREQGPWRRVAMPLCVFWLSVVALGWLGVLAPRFSMPTPFELALPSGIASERFVREITHLDATEFNPQSRNPIYRPAAPYPYTNNWGTAYAFLVPFVAAYVATVRRGVVRGLLLVSVPLSLVPAYLTLNRGMFIGLGIGLVYLLAREVARGRIRLLIPVGAFAGCAWVISLFIPVGEMIARRTSTTDTNFDRMDLYLHTWQAVLRSPLLGYGQPVTVDVTHASEPLGTQGMVWQMLYSHGIPATICLYLLLAVVAWRTAAAASRAGRWLSMLPVIAAVVTPFYSYIDPNMSVLFFGIGLALAAVDGPLRRPTPVGTR